ncbi:unnamed protein product [Rotaria socialis]|nr:unnamed protein product [Rotaria socialis]
MTIEEQERTKEIDKTLERVEKAYKILNEFKEDRFLRKNLEADKSNATIPWVDTPKGAPQKDDTFLRGQRGLRPSSSNVQPSSEPRKKKDKTAEGKKNKTVSFHVPEDIVVNTQIFNKSNNVVNNVSVTPNPKGAEGGSAEKTADPSPPNNLNNVSNTASLSETFSDSSDLSGICKELGISKTILEGGSEDEDILELSGIIASLSEEEEVSHDDCARRITEKNDSQTPDREYWRQNLARNFSPEMREKAEANRRADEASKDKSLICKETGIFKTILEGEPEYEEGLELSKIVTGSIEIPNETNESVSVRFLKEVWKKG